MLRMYRETILLAPHLTSSAASAQVFHVSAEHPQHCLDEVHA